MARVLVTGASGFLGRSLVSLLRSQHHEVRGLFRRPDQIEAARADGIEAVLGDVTAPESLPGAVEGMAIVFHLAAALGGRIADYDRVNRQGTENLVRACVDHAPDLDRFVLVSSRAAVGPSRDGRAVTGCTPPRPAYDYGVSKLGGEEAVAALAPRAPFGWVAIRPPLLYGPGDRLAFPLFRLAARGLYFRFPGGIRRFDMLQVRDAARAVARAAWAPGVEGRRIPVTGPRTVTPDALRDALAAAAGRRLREIRIPAGLLVAIAELLAPFRGRRVYHEFRFERQDADPAEARETLGFTAQVSLTEGIREAMDSYRKAGWIR